MRNMMSKTGRAAALAGALILPALLGAALPSPARALSELPACVTIDATGKSFKLIPLIGTGADLNQITNSEKFETEAMYVIVLWKNGAESMIRMDDGIPTQTGSHGVDFEGNSWTIATDVSRCGS